MSDTTEKAKTPAGADPLDFKDESNIRRFVRPNRWVSLDVAGIPVRARARDALKIREGRQRLSVFLETGLVFSKPG